MKYIKTYEIHENKNKYWKVRTDSPYYEISLKNIGMSKDEEDTFLKLRDNNNFQNRPVIYIEYWFDRPNTRESPYVWTHGSLENETENPTYMGEVEISPEDIEEYEIITNSKKYNI